MPHVNALMMKQARTQIQPYPPSGGALDGASGEGVCSASWLLSSLETVPLVSSMPSDMWFQAILIQENLSIQVP